MEQKLAPEELLEIERQVMNFISETFPETLATYKQRRRVARGYTATSFKEKTGYDYSEQVHRDILPATDLGFDYEVWKKTVTASANSWVVWIDHTLPDDRAIEFDGVLLHDLTDQKFTFIKFWIGTSAVKAIYSLTKAYKMDPPMISFPTPIKYDPNTRLRVEVYTTVANPEIDLELLGVTIEPIGKIIGSQPKKS